jgi:hypothetical protein
MFKILIFKALFDLGGSHIKNRRKAMTCIQTRITGGVICLLLSVFALPVMAEDSFTQADRERLVRVEATLTTFMQQVDKRFEQVDKRFEELRTDMNARFEQMTNMFYTLSAIFTTLFAAVFGFAWWDRRSILITARKTAREEVEACTREDRNTTQMVDRLVEVLRGFAEKSPDMKELMRRVNLL